MSWGQMLGLSVLSRPLSPPANGPSIDTFLRSYPIGAAAVIKLVTVSRTNFNRSSQ